MTVYNWRTIAVQTVIVATAALGMTLIMIAGGIDLSVGSVVALSASVHGAGSVRETHPPRRGVEARVPPIPLAWRWPAGVVLGGLCGLVNGGLITGLRVVPFIITLGSLKVYRGLAKWLSNSTSVYIPQEAKAWWFGRIMATEPDPAWLIVAPGVWVLLGLSLVLALVLRYTLLGRYVYAIGSNEATARLCGINVPVVKVTVYALAGLATGLAGVMQFIYLDATGDPTTADGLELQVIAAVVIGGASLSGGEGTVLGTLIGCLIMSVLNNGCVHAGIPNASQDIIIGVIIIAAVALDRYRRAVERRERVQSERQAVTERVSRISRGSVRGSSYPDAGGVLESRRAWHYNKATRIAAKPDDAVGTPSSDAVPIGRAGGSRPGCRRQRRGSGAGMSNAGERISQLLDEFRHSRDVMVGELNKVIIGQREVIEQILAAIFTRGHVLLVGVPGLAKTLMVSSVARILDVGFKRIQFTPDLMPSDITGTNVLEESESGRRSFRFVHGPIFSNIILADEINRTPPKTQAALLAGDAGARGHGRPGDVRAARPVLRDRHPEPDRAGRDVPAPRGPARPVHVRHPDRLPDPRRGGEDPVEHDPGRVGRAEQGALGQGDRQPPEARQLGAGLGLHGQVRRQARPRDPAERRRSRRSSSRTSSTSARAPGRPEPDPRRARRWPRWTAGSASRSTTSARSPSPCSGTGSAPTSRPRPRGRRPRA